MVGVGVSEGVEVKVGVKVGDEAGVVVALSTAGPQETRRREKRCNQA